ncbi:CGNR zinc finger domain-containing protein [Brevundimonas diminuta]|uniref:CGNR zinc finger domain-containing protein n=1 Tax=Brevundimonas diminuta TaxID=293 RepID=UPI00320793CF
MTMMDFPFFGNALWVDFLNTEPALPDGSQGDLIATPDAFDRWARAAGLASAEGLFVPDQAEMEEVLLFRTLLREGAKSLTASQPPPVATIAAVNQKLAHSPLISTLVESGVGWDLISRPKASPVAGLLGKVAADFAGTLVSKRSDKLRRCGHQGCAMLFIDTSKNGKRRWCSMETCGNREKAAGHRARMRRSATK